MTRAWLARRLAGPTERVRGDHDLNPGTGPKAELRPAAVLVAIVDHADEPTVLFTRRTDHLEHHPGQISFPGGHQEPPDESPEEAALREAEEEIGLPPGQVELLGRLDTYVTRTGFKVTPVVALVTPPVDLSPDPHEVAEVFEVPLAFLLDAANHRKCSRRFEGRERFFWAMPYGEYFIWGATAGMVRNLYDCLGKVEA